MKHLLFCLPLFAASCGHSIDYKVAASSDTQGVLITNVDPPDDYLAGLKVRDSVFTAILIQEEYGKLSVWEERFLRHEQKYRHFLKLLYIADDYTKVRPSELEIFNIKDSLERHTILADAAYQKIKP